MRSAFLAAVCLLPLAAFASDEEVVTMYGKTATTSCGQFVAAMEGHKLDSSTKLQRNGVTYWSENALMTEYVFGLLTAVNMSRDEKHQIHSDGAAIELWLRNWCTKNPTELLVTAAVKFVIETTGTPVG